MLVMLQDKFQGACNYCALAVKVTDRILKGFPTFCACFDKFFSIQYFFTSGLVVEPRVGSEFGYSGPKECFWKKFPLICFRMIAQIVATGGYFSHPVVKSLPVSSKSEALSTCILKCYV